MPFQKGHKLNNGRVRSLETRIKIGISKKGKKQSKQHLIKLSESRKGRIVSEDVKKRISKSMILNGHTPPVLKGKKNHFYGKNMFGENNPRWIKDRTKLQTSYTERRSSRNNDFIKQVRMRDGCKCKIDNKDCKGQLEVHHILSWRDHSELRYDINNGITLCHFPHPRKYEDEKRLSPYFKELIVNNS